MESDGLPDANSIANYDRATVFLNSHHIRDEEVTQLESFLVFVDDDTQMRSLLQELLVIGRELREKLIELVEARFASELVNKILFRLRDDEVWPDRPATLRDDRRDRWPASNDDSDGSMVDLRFSLKQAVLAWTATAAGHAADDWHSRQLLTKAVDDLIDRR